MKITLYNIKSSD